MLERRRWWSLANPLAFSAKRKTGMGKKAGPGWREENRRKPSIDAGAGSGSCPWAKINSRWQWDKMLKQAPARADRRSRSCAGQMSLEPSGGWERHGCEQAAFSAGSLLKQGLCAFPTPPGWVSEQPEVQVVQPAERPGLSPGGRRSSTESSGSNQGMQQTRQ